MFSETIHHFRLLICFITQLSHLFPQSRLSSSEASQKCSIRTHENLIGVDDESYTVGSGTIETPWYYPRRPLLSGFVTETAPTE